MSSGLGGIRIGRASSISLFFSANLISLRVSAFNPVLNSKLTLKQPCDTLYAWQNLHWDVVWAL